MPDIEKMSNDKIQERAEYIKDLAEAITELAEAIQNYKDTKGDLSI